MTGVWSWQERHGREETGGAFSVALNIFLYCHMCSMLLCLHVNQGGKLGIVWEIRRVDSPPLRDQPLWRLSPNKQAFQPWGEVRPTAGRLHTPHRRSAARLADSVFLSLSEERHSWLAANGFACFYWQYLANERMNSCRAGCLLVSSDSGSQRPLLAAAGLDWLSHAWFTLQWGVNTHDVNVKDLPLPDSVLILPFLLSPASEKRTNVVVRGGQSWF